MTTSFQEIIEIDLKFFRGKMLLCLVDHYTLYLLSKQSYQIKTKTGSSKLHFKFGMSHNIRATVKYLTGNSVQFKWVNSNEWHGPDTVLGQDRVYLKNGSAYPCLHLVVYNYTLFLQPTLFNSASVFLPFSWIELQMFFRYCLLHISPIALWPIL